MRNRNANKRTASETKWRAFTAGCDTYLDRVEHEYGSVRRFERILLRESAQFQITDNSPRSIDGFIDESTELTIRKKFAKVLHLQ